MYLTGRLIGYLLMGIIVIPMRLIYGSKKFEIKNAENLKTLNGSSIFLASNHIKPRNRFLKLLSMPYDAYIGRAALKKLGYYSTALTSYDAGKRNKGSKLSKGEKIKELLIKGMIKSIDLIPLNRNETDPDTMRQLKVRLDAGNLGIGIFPEGTFFRGYRKSRKLHGGVAILAKRYELPILPIYIDAYNLNMPVTVSFGTPILNPKDSLEVSTIIRMEWNSLRNQIQNDRSNGISIENAEELVHA